MRSQPTIPAQPWGPTPASPSFPILESKLTPPPMRPGLVSRVRLLDWLEASAAAPVVAICGPAGYGKTVLAAEWAKRDPLPFVWLSIDRHDNDPAVLLTYLAVGLDRVEPIDPAVFAALASRVASITRTVVPRLGAALSSKALPVVVVLDDVHAADEASLVLATVVRVSEAMKKKNAARPAAFATTPAMAAPKAAGRVSCSGTTRPTGFHDAVPSRR